VKVTTRNGAFVRICRNATPESVSQRIVPLTFGRTGTAKAVALDCFSEEEVSGTTTMSVANHARALGWGQSGNSRMISSQKLARKITLTASFQIGQSGAIVGTGSIRLCAHVAWIFRQVLVGTLATAH
jgi:hypothetical protein